MQASDVFVGWVPLFHDLGLVRFVFAPVHAGGTCHLVPSGLASLRRWFDTMTRVRATVTASSDFGYRVATRLIDPASVDIRSLRVATNGGEAVRLSTIERFEQRFGLERVVLPGYGLAEATLGVTTRRAGRTDPRSTRTPGVLRSADGRRGGSAGGRMLASGNLPGHEGVIEVRGPSVFAGYLGDELATGEVLRPGGWLHTGDRGIMDTDGHLYVLGRDRALIKRAGATIAPREIEEVVDALSGVRSSAAVGIADHRVDSTEEIAVVVEVERSKASEAEDAALASRVADVVAQAVGVRPAWVLVEPRGSIPRTSNGKTQVPDCSERASRRRCKRRLARPEDWRRVSEAIRPRIVQAP